jgi:hypothetical protein
MDAVLVPHGIDLADHRALATATTVGQCGLTPIAPERLSMVKQVHLVGGVEEAVGFFQTNAAILNGKGVPVNAIVAELNTKKDVLVTKATEQKNLKTALKDKTEETNEAHSDLYDTFTNKIDAACSAVGKKSNLAKQIARIRKDLRKKGGKGQADESSVTPLNQAA